MLIVQRAARFAGSAIALYGLTNRSQLTEFLEADNHPVKAPTEYRK